MQQSGRWGYTFSYRAHGPGDGYAEMTGNADSPYRLDEMALQNLVLEDLSEDEGVPDGMTPDNLVITRFLFTEIEPLSAPEDTPGQ